MFAVEAIVLILSILHALRVLKWLEILKKKISVSSEDNFDGVGTEGSVGNVESVKCEGNFGIVCI